MLGATIAELRAEGMLPATGDGARLPEHAPVAVKEAVLPFHRFRTPEGHGVDSLLGPEMKSTGEVMGIDSSFGKAFAKSQTAAYGSLPTSGRVFVSVANSDKRAMIFPVKRLADLGFEILATAGTAAVLRRNGIPCTEVRKHFEGEGNVVDMILAGEVDMVFNTPYGNSGPRIDGYEIRTAAVAKDIPCVTTIQGAAAAVHGIEALIRGDIGVQSLQELQAALRGERVTFGARLAKAVAAHGPLCVGIDPHPGLLDAWGLSRRPPRPGTVRADGVEAFGGRVVDGQAAGGVLRGLRSRGVAVLERVIAGLRDSGHAGAAGRQARRHRLDDGRLRAGLPGGRLAAGRGRGDGVAVPRVRLAAARAGRGAGRPGAGCSCWR